jgi:hypothetical protein
MKEKTKGMRIRKGDVSSYWMSLRKREDSGILKRKN